MGPKGNRGLLKFTVVGRLVTTRNIHEEEGSGKQRLSSIKWLLFSRRSTGGPKVATMRSIEPPVYLISACFVVSTSVWSTCLV